MTNRSCKVRLARSTRPLAWLLFDAQYLDVQLGQHATELGHARHALARLCNPKDRVLVAVERHRATMLEQVAK